MRLEQLLARSAELLRSGRNPEARSLLREALAQAPHDPDANYLMAHAALQAGLLNEAQRAIGAATLGGTQRPDFLVLYGNILRLQGDLAGALGKFVAALRAEPENAEIRLNVANLLGELGRFEEALELLDTVLRRKPDWQPALLSRALALRRAGRIDEARGALANIAWLYPSSPDATYALGRLEEEQGRPDAARAAYEKVLGTHPGHADARNQLGLLRLAGGDRAGALAQFEECLRHQPRHPGALGNSATLLAASGRRQEAARLYRTLLSADPRNAQARLAWARLLMEAGHYGEARRELARLERQAPDWIDVHLTVVENYIYAGHYGRAQSANARALALEPRNFTARLNRGLLAGETGDAENALPILEGLLEEAPDDPRVLAGLGAALRSLGREEQGVAHFLRALELDPDAPAAHYNLSYAYLKAGDFARGWHHQGRRWSGHEARRFRSGLEAPLWRGEPLAGKRLFIRAEQGLGDQIMFASMLPDLLAAGAKCVVECAGRLASLLGRSFPQAEILAVQPGRLPEGRIDYYCPMSSLGEFLRNDLAQFPAHDGYLVPDPQRRERWRARLEALGPGLKVGISWRGGTDRTERGARSTRLTDWAPVLSVPGARFVSVQYGDCLADLEALRQAGGPALPHWPQAGSDMEECAALLSELDLLVSVTTTAIHMAGALSRPAWVLVPSLAGWRYLKEGERLPWYPASLRMIRQEPGEEWALVLRRVGAQLQALRR
jgi:tetratricopeptide (TPR) repeat protein